MNFARARKICTTRETKEENETRGERERERGNGKRKHTKQAKHDCRAFDIKCFRCIWNFDALSKTSLNKSRARGACTFRENCARSFVLRHTETNRARHFLRDHTRFTFVRNDVPLQLALLLNQSPCDAPFAASYVTRHLILARICDNCVHVHAHTYCRNSDQLMLKN